MSNNPYEATEPADEVDLPADASAKMKHGFLGHAAKYGLGSISLQIVSLILLPLYTWKMDPADFGVLQLLYRVGDVMNICLMVNGIQLAVLNFWGKADSDDERGTIAPSVAIFTCCFLLCGGFVVLLLSGVLANLLNVSDWRLLACGIMAMMLQATTILPMALMQAKFQSKQYVIASLSIAGSQLVLVFVALVVLNWGIWGVVLAFGLNNALFGLLLNARVLAESSWRPNMKQMGNLVQFALPLLPSGLCFFVLHNGDQFFLVNHHGTYVLGIYALAYKIAKSVVFFAAQPLTQVWNAWMYDAYKEENRAEVFGRSVTRIMSAIALAGTLVVIFKCELFFLLGAGKFAGAADVVAPLVLANAVLILANLFDAPFYVTSRTNLKPLIAAASTVFILAAYFILIPRYAAQGAAIATLIGFTFHFALTLFVSRRAFAIKVETKRMVWLAVISIGLCAIAEWLGPGVQVLPQKIALAVAWPAIFLGVGLITPFERKYLRDAICQTLTRFMLKRV